MQIYRTIVSKDSKQTNLKLRYVWRHIFVILSVSFFVGILLDKWGSNNLPPPPCVLYIAPNKLNGFSKLSTAQIKIYYTRSNKLLGVFQVFTLHLYPLLSTYWLGLCLIPLHSLVLSVGFTTFLGFKIQPWCFWWAITKIVYNNFYRFSFFGDQNDDPFQSLPVTDHCRLHNSFWWALLS